jgi:fatty acid kinase fatty acid binding subunit
MELTARNTAIVLDSTADFPDGPARFPNLRIVPLYVRFGAESFKDYLEIEPDEFYARLRSSPELPTTSQPTPGDFVAAYEQLEGYERIIVLPIASSLSGTCQSATTAAELEGSGRVRVLDTRTASAAIAILALAVQRRLERGTTDEEVEALAARYTSQAGLLFTVETLEYLRRGGRIGRAAALAGDMLSIRPILSIVDAEVVPLKRVRGNHKAFLEFAREFESRSRDVPELKVGIAHADAPQKAEALHELVRRTRPHAEIELSTTLGPVLGTHAGPGCVGFFWFEDD